MLRALVTKEFRGALRDGRFRAAAAAVLLLGFAAVAAGWQGWRTAARERAAAAGLERANWLGQGEKNPHGAAHYGMHVFRPLPPLALFDRGVGGYVGTAVYLEAHVQNPLQYLPAQDATALRRFGELTGALVLQVLAPLLVVFLTFDAVAGERERGTLRLLLSLGAAPRTLLLGKALGLGAVLAALLAPLAAVALVALAGLGPPEPLRVAGLAAGYGLYFAVWLLLGLAVSALARSSRAALATLLGLWLLNAVLAPRLAADLAERRHPTPRWEEFRRALDQDLAAGPDGHDDQDRRLAERRQEVMREHGVTNLADLPFNFDGLSLQESEVHGDAVYDRHFGALWDGFAGQQARQRAGAVVAPLLALRPLSMALSGTDLAAARAFGDAAEQHRRAFVKALNTHLMTNSRTGDWEFKAGPELWAAVPPFAPPAASARADFRRTLPEFGLLALWTTAGGLLLAFAAARLRPD